MQERDKPSTLLYKQKSSDTFMFHGEKLLNQDFEKAKVLWGTQVNLSGEIYWEFLCTPSFQ